MGIEEWERLLYEQHSSEIPQLKVAEAAEKPVSSEETLSNLSGFMKENNVGMFMEIL